MFFTRISNKNYFINLEAFELEPDNLNQLKLTTPKKRFQSLKKLFKDANNTGHIIKPFANFVIYIFKKLN